MLRSGPCHAKTSLNEAIRKDRQKQIQRILIAILAANLGVALAKYGYGLYANLVSMRADGLHSVTDGASNIVGLLALRLASAPPDERHPYGHRKFEVLASLAIGVLILFGMLQVLNAVFDSALNTSRPEIGPGGYAVALITLAVNLTVATVESRAGKRLNSMILTADARHTFSDSLATMGVLVAMILISYGWTSADIIATLVIVLMIMAAAWSIFKTGAASLLDEALLPPERLRSMVLSIPGVEACHALRSRGQPDFVFVDLHVLVDPDMTVRDGHHLSHEVSQHLLESFPEIAEVLVHTEPWDDDDAPPYESTYEGPDPSSTTDSG